MIEPPPAVPPGGAGVEFEIRVPPSGGLTLVPGKQQIPVSPGLVGRTLTAWADLRSIHLLLDGHVLRTVASLLAPADLAFLAMHGARPAGQPPRPCPRRRCPPDPSAPGSACTPAAGSWSACLRPHIDSRQ